MQKLRYTNTRDETIVFGNSPPYILSHIDGVGGVDTEIKKTRSPYQDGSSISNVKRSDRLITLQGSIMAKSQRELYDLRRFLTRILNSKNSGSLIYSNDYKDYLIGATVEEGPMWGARYSTNQLFTVSFLCPDPFLLDTYEETEEIASWIGGINFPLVFPSCFAVRGPSIINVFNNGDEETPVTIEIIGPATNPRITNQSTGQYIQINKVLQISEKLTITTQFGNKKVEIEDIYGEKTNVLNWIDLGSTFWQLQLGDNVVEYLSGNQDEPIAVSIKYRNRYSGA